jgi:hypothetical protein
MPRRARLVTPAGSRPVSVSRREARLGHLTPRRRPRLEPSRSHKLQAKVELDPKAILSRATKVLKRELAQQETEQAR